MKTISHAITSFLPGAAFESISTFERLWRTSLPCVASQYAASDFYPITLCEVCGHAGHSSHNGGCHLWCDILQRFFHRICLWPSLWIIQRLHPHRREWGTGLHSKQIFCSPSSQIWSVGHCKCQIITWCPPPSIPHTHTPFPPVWVHLASEMHLGWIIVCRWRVNWSLVGEDLPHETDAWRYMMIHLSM